MPKDSENVQQLTEKLFAKPAAERDGMFPGLTLDKITSDIGHELKQQVAAGAHELAAALFNGSAFVMYPRTDNAKEEHGVHGPEQMPAQAPQNDQLQMERGGRSM